MKNIVLLVAILCVALTNVKAQDNNMEVLHKVTALDIENWSKELTKEEYRGRRTGDQGYDKAAAWVAHKYKSWGVKPFGDNGTYFNSFTQPYNDVLEAGHLKGLFVVGKDTIVKQYPYLVDFFPTALSGNGDITAEVVYVGHGISAPELKYDCYKGIDVKDKIVLCELGMPYKGTNNDTLKMWEGHLSSESKIRNAISHGAVGMMFIYPVSNAAPTIDEKFVMCYISTEVAKDFLAGGAYSLDELRKLSSKMTPRSVNTKKIANIKAVTKYYPNRTGANVVGVIQGSDPLLKDEYIIVGGHLDHLGMMPEIFVGALDNASGSAIVMGVAKAIAMSGVKLKRSVIVINLAAEELGLLGTKHFLETMPIKKENINLMVNLDMLGMGDGFNVSASEHAALFADMFKVEIDKWIHRPVNAWSTKWSYNLRPRTDGAEFENEKIGVIYFSLSGEDKKIYYHHPKDTMDQLDSNIMRDAARAIAMSVIAVANR